MLYWIGFVLFHILSWLWFPRKIRGLNNVPKSGGVILACNHASNLDPFIVGISFFRRVSFVAKDSLFRTPFGGFVMREWGAFPIKREGSDVGAFKEALNRLHKGNILVIFPEGTRREDGPSVGNVQSGVGLLAIKSGYPVIPVFVGGSNKVLPRGAKFFKRHVVNVVFGQPLKFNKNESYKEVARQIMHSVYALKSPV